MFLPLYQYFQYMNYGTHTATTSGSHESNVSERTFETCTPRLRCTPLHSMHNTMPRLTLAQRASKRNKIHFVRTFILLIMFYALFHRHTLLLNSYHAFCNLRTCCSLVRIWFFAEWIACPLLLVHPKDYYLSNRIKFYAVSNSSYGECCTESKR